MIYLLIRHEKESSRCLKGEFLPTLQYILSFNVILPRDAMLARCDMLSSCPSVCPSVSQSVCHTPVLYQNG